MSDSKKSAQICGIFGGPAVAHALANTSERNCVAPFVNNILGPAVNTGGTFGPAGDKPRTADGFAAIFAALFAATQPTAQSAQAFPASGNAGIDLQAVPLSPAPNSDTGSFRLSDASVWNAGTHALNANVRLSFAPSADAPINTAPAALAPGTNVAADITDHPIQISTSADMNDAGLSPAALGKLALPGLPQISSPKAGAVTAPSLANASSLEASNLPDGPQTEPPNGFTIPTVFADPSPLAAAGSYAADQSSRSLSLDHARTSSAVWNRNPIVIQAGGFSFPVTIGLAQVPPSPALPWSAGSLSAATVAQAFDASGAHSESSTDLQSEMEPAAFKVASQPSSFLWSGTLNPAADEDSPAVSRAQALPMIELRDGSAGWKMSDTDEPRVVANSKAALPNTSSAARPSNTSPATTPSPSSRTVSPSAVQKPDLADSTSAGLRTNLSHMPTEPYEPSAELLPSARDAKAPATRNSSAELPGLPRDNERPAAAVSAKPVNGPAAVAPSKPVVAQTMAAGREIALGSVIAAKPILAHAVVAPAKPAIAQTIANGDVGATQTSAARPQVQSNKDERAAAQPTTEKNPVPKVFSDASAALEPPSTASTSLVGNSGPQKPDNAQTASHDTGRAASQSPNDSGSAQPASAETSQAQTQSAAPSSQTAAPANNGVADRATNASIPPPAAQAVGGVNVAVPHAAQTQASSTGSTAQPAGGFAPISVDAAQFASRILAKVKDGDRQFDIRLDPPELGRVDVQLSVTRDGQAQAHVIADKPQALDALQRDQQILHRALKDAGLDLGNNSLNFSLKGQDRGGDGTMPRYVPSRHASTATDIPNAPPAPSFTARRAADGRLDIRV